MSEEETERYSFDEESTEHLLFLGAVVSIVADGTATGGAPSLSPRSTLRRAMKITFIRTRPMNYSTSSVGR